MVGSYELGNIAILRDCYNEDTIYGVLVLKYDKKTKGFNRDEIQKRIYELKEEIGADYTVDEIVDRLCNEFDNIENYYDLLEDDLEI